MLVNRARDSGAIGARGTLAQRGVADAGLTARGGWRKRLEWGRETLYSRYQEQI